MKAIRKMEAYLMIFEELGCELFKVLPLFKAKQLF